MEVPGRFDPPQQIREVVLVGCGGTGAVLARCLCRIVYDLKRRRKHAPSIKFVDPDRVEPKNVGRQMFTQADADAAAFKAEVHARRFNYGLGLDVSWYGERFEVERHASPYSLVCGCVDNHLARRELAKHEGLWLDCGNHVDSGQVILGNTSSLERLQGGAKDGVYRYLPNAALLFPALLDPEPEPAPQSAVSCAELLEAAEQDLLINDLVATAAAHYLYKLLNHEPISTFLTFCDAGAYGLNLKSIPVTRENLHTYMELAER
ncbi:MAG: PRTRC system ThiF family protein [Anaerolinea sp.]|nr:PRTRC system ThiF family protein [Anaerolinea sp.]